MPQPLNKVMRTASTAFGPGFLETRPHLANIVAFVIGNFSYVELQFSLVYHRTLGTDAAVAFSMLRASQARRQAINNVNAAASHTVPKSELDIFNDVLARFKAAAKIRDTYAHSLWGTSDQLPDALLLAGPEYYHHMEIAHDRAKKDDRIPSISELRPPTEMVMVYREDDLKRDLKQINDTNELLRATVGLLSLPIGPQRDVLSQKISELLHPSK